MKIQRKILSVVLTLVLFFAACSGGGGGSALISGTNSPAATTVNLAETGQTSSYAANDDGALGNGVTWPPARFTVGVDCVRDNLTGLLWMKAPTASRSWENALVYADGLDLCGFSDWRLSNINELESLINAEESNSAAWLNTQGFSGISANAYWSSTSGASSSIPSTRAWYIDMGNGRQDTTDKTLSNYVWPVRGGL